MNWVDRGELLQCRLFANASKEDAQAIEEFVHETSKHPIAPITDGRFKTHTYNVLRVYDSVYQRIYGTRTPLPYLVGAFLHDIGKLQQVALFTSDRSFTPEERLLSQRHTIDGSKFLKTVYEDSVIADMALLHHERSDGTGYPTGEGRVDDPIALLATVDPYVAILENRKYRRNHPLEEWTKVRPALFADFVDDTEQFLLSLMIEQSVVG